MDADASWIVFDEANEFVWPDVDRRPISRAKPGVWTYGVLPRELFDEPRSRLRRMLDQRRVQRDEQALQAHQKSNACQAKHGAVEVARYVAVYQVLT